MVVRYRSATPQKFGKLLAAEKQLVRRHAAAISPRGLINEILRNDRFEAGEMVEEENLTRVNVPVGVVDLDVDSKPPPQHGKCSHAPLIQDLVDLELGVDAHFGSGWYSASLVSVPPS
jgi:hypothetical protein